jgi:thioredoxin-related protein
MKYLWISVVLLLSLESFAGDSTKLYNPLADAKKDIAAAVAKANKEGKHVMLQIGGNWCIWCYRFDGFVKSDTALNRMIKENYIVYHLNYSGENKNLDVLKSLGFPQRFGFPVFVILDENGQRLHTQDSGFLEKEKSYDPGKIKTFLQAWSPKALDEKNYKE